jgi:predicted  nucleic acid-binding Zn-ribbon protein
MRHPTTTIMSAATVLAVADITRRQARQESRVEAATRAHELAAVQALADRLAASRRREVLLEQEVEALESEVHDLEAEIAMLHAELARRH